jgi:hypothetical protein
MGAKYEVVGHVVGSRVKNVGDKITKSGLNGVKPSSLFNFLSVFIFVSVFAGITICLVNLRFVFRCQTSWKESQDLANINTQSMPRPTSRGFVGPHRGFERLEAMSRSPTADRRPEKGVDVSCPWGGLIQALFKSKFKILRSFQSTDPLNLSFAHVSKYHPPKPLGSVGPFNFQASFPYAPCVLHTNMHPKNDQTWGKTYHSWEHIGLFPWGVGRYWDLWKLVYCWETSPWYVLAFSRWTKSMFP